MASDPVKRVLCPGRRWPRSVHSIILFIAALNQSLVSSTVPTDTEVARVENKPTDEALRTFAVGVRDLQTMLRIPGLSLAVLKDGQIIYRQKEGFANLQKRIPIADEHLFQIASITKTFTANVVMQYEEAHLASLDDYALKYRFINTNFGWPYNIDPNIRVRHFLSHTSEDGPGRSFIYNGQRFNYIYGLFEAVGGYAPNTEAYSQEVKKRIFEPLKMTHSITGFPKNRADPIWSHIATPYVYDREKAAFVEDVVNYQWTQAFPATGILTTIDDLAKYTASYDTNALISAASYAEITSPQRLSDGSLSPYGIGWFSEKFAGKTLHWHYGHADSYAALLVRVPEMGFTFLFLSNSNAPSDALRLGAGHIWQSPFVTLFLQHFVFAGARAGTPEARALEVEHDIGVALFSHYAAKLYHADDAAPQIIERLFAQTPERFDQYDPALVALLSEIDTKSADAALEQLIAAFERYGHPQPYVSTDLAKHFARKGDRKKAFYFFQQVADSSVFETWDIGIDACLRCGEYLMDEHQTTAGRAYYWRAVKRMKNAGADDKAIQTIIDQMNRRGSQS